MVDFKAPSAGTILRAGPTNPITAIIKSIFGVFVGLGLILFLAPAVLWFAESQNTDKIFTHSKEVSSISSESGYIRTTDLANSITQNECYKTKVEGNCLFYDYILEELTYTVKDYCGDIKSNQVVLENKGQKCRRDSNDEEICEQCYSVNESNWMVIESDRKIQPFSIGSYKVDSPSNAKVIFPDEYTKSIDNLHREKMTYILDSTSLLVAGKSDGKIISNGGKNQFLLISKKDYAGTYEILKAQDNLTAWLLRGLTFFLLLIGYFLIFGPISVFSNFVRKIPLLGKFIDNAVGGIIFLISLLLAIVHFILLWVLIFLLKNILYIIAFVAIILIVIYLITYFRKQRS